MVPEPDQRLDNDQTEETPVIPTGFLSPSVKEYLELGKSIPGENKFQFKSNENCEGEANKLWKKPF